jgi:hypothetical protein
VLAEHQRALPESAPRLRRLRRRDPILTDVGDCCQRQTASAPEVTLFECDRFGRGLTRTQIRSQRTRPQQSV